MTEWLGDVIGMFPEDTPEHHELLAFIFQLLAYRSFERAEQMRKRALQVENKAIRTPGPRDSQADQQRVGRSAIDGATDRQDQGGN